jgi:hypothetical protein
MYPADLGDRISEAVIERFRALPSKFKPAKRDATLQEWVPLAGIVIAQGEPPL